MDNQEQQVEQHKRRVTYKGTHSRNYKQKYGGRLKHRFFITGEFIIGDKKVF